MKTVTLCAILCLAFVAVCGAESFVNDPDLQGLGLNLVDAEKAWQDFSSSNPSVVAEVQVHPQAMRQVFKLGLVAKLHSLKKINDFLLATVAAQTVTIVKSTYGIRAKDVLKELESQYSLFEPPTVKILEDEFLR